MAIETVRIDELTESPYNYRRKNRDVDDIAGSLENGEPDYNPIVRPASNGSDAKYEIIDGGYRVKAVADKGEQTIEVDVRELSDLEASRLSIRSDTESLKNWRSIHERTLALITHWKEIGGEGNPSATKLADDLQIPRSTIDRWLETARDEWEGTPIHAEFVNNQTGVRGEHLSINVDDVGDGTLGDIRRSVKYADEDIEKGVELAKEVERDKLTRDDIREIKQLVKEEDMTLSEAQAEVMLEEGEASSQTEQQPEQQPEIPDQWDIEPQQKEEQNREQSAEPQTSEEQEQYIPDIQSGGIFSEEDVEEFAETFNERQKKHEFAKQDPEVQKNIRLLNSLNAHRAILAVAHELICPDCNLGYTNLVWSCENHEDINIEDATDMIREKLENRPGIEEVKQSDDY